MLMRFLAISLAFGAVVSNAAAVQSGPTTVEPNATAIELSDPADTFDNNRDAVATVDTTRNTTVTKGAFCGSHLSDEEFNRVEDNFQKLLGSNTSVSADNSTDSSRYGVVDVYWHVVYTRGNKGLIDRSLIYSNINALNTWYRGTGLQFRLKRVDYTYSPRWFEYASIEYFGEWTNMGKFTRRGGAKDLNLWSTGMTRSGFIGYARFPYEYSGTPYNDGALLRYDQLDSGKLITHEVGHWVGLFHTFQGGCTWGNDGVADTPASASPTSGCPRYRDSCPGRFFPGFDPIHNHMDYSSDYCRYEFTRGQTLRMKQQCRYYRGLYF